MVLGPHPTLRSAAPFSLHLLLGSSITGVPGSAGLPGPKDKKGSLGIGTVVPGKPGMKGQKGGQGK